MALEERGDTPRTPEEELRRLFADAETWSAAHPDAFEEAAARFRKVAARARELEKSAWASKAEREAARLGLARVAAADKAFAGLEKEARRLTAKRDFDGALALAKPGSAPEAFAPLLAERIEKLAGELRDSAEKAFRKPLAAARAHLAAGEPAKGLEALAALEGARYAPRAGDAAALAKKLEALASAQAKAEADRLADAAAAFEKTLDAFDRALERDADDRDASFPRVRALLGRASGNEKLEPVSARVTGLAEIADALERIAASEAAALKALKDGRKKTFRTRDGREITGVVKSFTAEEIVVLFREGGGLASVEIERRVRFADLAPEERARLRGDFKPAKPVEHLAFALWSLATGDPDPATSALAAAKEHPLAARYAERLKKEKEAGGEEED